MSTNVRDLISNLIFQDKGTSLETLVSGLLDLTQEELVDPIVQIDIQASVLTAEGVNLDLIGARILEPRVGVAREDIDYFGFEGNGLGFDQAPFINESSDSIVPITDDLYRRYLIARGSQLITDCSVPDMNRILEQAFGDGHYIDHGDMSMTIRLDLVLRDDEIQAAVDTGLFTKPAGVQLRNITITHNKVFFGFQGNGLGFNQAPFAKIVQV